MHKLLLRTSKVLHNLKLEFPKEDLEKNYKAFREKNMVKDFKDCMLFLIIYNGIAFITALATDDWLNVYTGGGTVGALLILLFLLRYLTRYIQFLTLLVIFSYNITRFFLADSLFKGNAKGRLFLAGFAMGTLQNVLFLQVLKVSHKAIGISIVLALRFVIITVYLAPGPFSVLTFVRHFVIDSYIIYKHYSNELSFRKIFLNFIQKKEELLKFTELLSDSLPQSLLVITQTSNAFLFGNKAFENTFNATNHHYSFSENSSHNCVKPILESLIVEKSSIREVGTSYSILLSLADLYGQISLKDVLMKLSSGDLLNSKTISVTASMAQENNRRLFEITLKKVKWDNEDAIAVLFNDITYQESLIALKLANINKDKVIATVSHELRTPLNGIIGILDIAERKVENPEVSEYLSLCKDNAQLLMSLVNSILDLQQISAGKLKLNPAPVNIHKAISSITQLFYFQCKEKNLALECNIQKDVPKYIFTDENRLKQVLINLVGNAIKFTSKGNIKIEVVLPVLSSENLQISVTDTGIGIKQEDLKHLFKMYSKLESGESVNKNGVGLGLTISNALVMLLNGNTSDQGINVKSESGAGTKFSFTVARNLQEKKQIISTKIELTEQEKTNSSLVLTRNDNDTTRGLFLQKPKTTEEPKPDEYFDEDQQKICDEFFMPSELQLKVSQHAFPNTHIELANSPKKVQLTKTITQDQELQTFRQSSRRTYKPEPIILDKPVRDIHILIVDDNPFNLLVAKNLIQELGCKIMTCLGGQEAIETIKRNFSNGITFNIIFMDCQMPIMDGFETTKALQELMKTNEIPRIPIYGWTANNSEEDVNRCYEVGMVGHLPKPASKLDFSKIINDL